MTQALLRRRAVIAAKQESSEGSAESLSGSDATTLTYNPKFEADFDKFDRDPARAYLSHLASLIGKQAAKFSMRTELKGSGTVTTAPAWATYLLGCGFQQSRVSAVTIGAVTSGPFVPGEVVTQATSLATGRVVGEVSATPLLIVVTSGVPDATHAWTGATSGASATPTTGASYYMAIGAVTSGPFTDGETITGGTSGATGKVVGATANGAATIAFTTLTGTFVSGETITGGSSAATATTSGDPLGNKGFEYRPLSSGPPSLTIARYLDNTLKQQLLGARGNVKLTANVGEPTFLEFDFLGVYDAVTDASAPTPTYETTVPPVFKGVGFSIQSLQAVFSKFAFDMKNGLQARESANASKGILSVFIGNRNPSGSIDPELGSVAAHDFYGKLSSSATGRMAFKLGSTAGNTVWVAGPLVQYEAVGDDDRGGIAVAGVEVGYKSATVNTGDDELIIAVV